MTNLGVDVILAFFGYNESFEGEAGLQNFKDELQAFIEHSQKQKYNGETSAELVLVSPIAFEDLSSKMDLPNGVEENKNLKLYTEAIREVAAKNNVPFVDAFTPSAEWMNLENAITADGFQLNDEGYRKFAKLLKRMAFGLL